MFYKFKNKLNIYNILTIVFFVVGSSYLFIPFYRLVCSLDTSYINTSDIAIFLQKIKNFLSWLFSTNESNHNLWLRCSFLTKTNNLFMQILPLNEEIILQVNEPILSIYKVINNTNKFLTFNSHFYIFPPVLESNFIKIQCFCFQEQLIDSFEVLEIPLFFYIDILEKEYIHKISKHIIVHCLLYIN